MQVHSQHPYGPQPVFYIDNDRLRKHVAKMIDGLHHVANMSSQPVESVMIPFKLESDKPLQLVGSQKSPDNVAYIQIESKAENNRAELRLELTEHGVIAAKDGGQFAALPKIWAERVVEANKRVKEIAIQSKDFSKLRLALVQGAGAMIVVKSKKEEVYYAVTTHIGGFQIQRFGDSSETVAVVLDEDNQFSRCLVGDAEVRFCDLHKHWRHAIRDVYATYAIDS